MLSLPPYHCFLNPIEMICNQLKTHACQLNVFTKKPSNVVYLITEVFEKKILPVHFVNYDINDHKEEENFKNFDSL